VILCIRPLLGAGEMIIDDNDDNADICDLLVLAL